MLIEELPNELNTLIDSYIDRRVCYKYEVARCQCCKGSYLLVVRKWVQREYYYFAPPGTKQIEPGLIVAFRDRGFYYSGTYW